MKIETSQIILAQSEAGAGKRGASLGTTALLFELKEQGCPLPENIIYTTQYNDQIENEKPSFGKHVKIVLKAAIDLEAKMRLALFKNNSCFILSGDHSNAAASVSAFSNHFGVENCGLIWIDAHADLHTPYTTPSGNFHGMPVAAILGLNKNSDRKIPDEIAEIWKVLINLGSSNLPKILPENIVFIGIRDLEEAEWKVIHLLGITYFTPKDIAEIGIASIIEKTKNKLEHLNHWYVSFDADSIDPKISAGTGTPVNKGLTDAETLFCIDSLLKDKKTACFEITEINPLLDRENMMAKFIAKQLTLANKN